MLFIPRLFITAEAATHSPKPICFINGLADHCRIFLFIPPQQQHEPKSEWLTMHSGNSDFSQVNSGFAEWWQYESLFSRNLSSSGLFFKQAPFWLDCRLPSRRVGHFHSHCQCSSQIHKLNLHKESKTICKMQNVFTSVRIAERKSKLVRVCDFRSSEQRTAPEWDTVAVETALMLVHQMEPIEMRVAECEI